MKLYDYTIAPNPRRARIFIAEKGLEIEIIQVDLRQKEQFSETFKAINPRCAVPVLLLDDGTAITENKGIAAYLEATHPEPPLLGKTPTEKAMIAMWNARMEYEGMLAVSEAFRNHAEGFVGRAISGPEAYPQIPELVERGKKRTQEFFQTLDAQLAQHEFICGDNFSMADITAMVAVDFADWIKLGISPQQKHLQRWYEVVSNRPSAKA
ncbi:MAG: glutathione S-transferase family protein [Gammaproteobacteria bacterium]